MTEVIVIGAGASGLVAAITAARNGAKVKIIEKNNKPGKKLLATGNGRCNITNKIMSVDKYRSNNIKFVEKLLLKYKTEDITGFFNDLSIMTKDIKGYVYPFSLQSSTIVDRLVSACNSLGVKIILDTNVIDIKNANGKYTVVTDKGNYTGEKVIVSTGSNAGTTGKNGDFALKYAKKTKHKIYPFVEGLTGLKTDNRNIKMASGVRWDSKVHIYVDNKEMASDRGELQFADYGISGIVVFQVSRYASLALNEGKKVRVIMDLMPDMEENELAKILIQRKNDFGKMSLYDMLSGIFNNKLVNFILANAGFKPDIKLKNFDGISDLVKIIKNLMLNINGTRGLEFAQVCAGGIDTREIDDNMQSVRMKGIYFTGEALDVDGVCGGYNLHFAFATGIIAGKSCTEWS